MKALYIGLQDEVCEPEKGIEEEARNVGIGRLNLAPCPLCSTAPTVSVLGYPV
jgi:hypothetical protein